MPLGQEGNTLQPGFHGSHGALAITRRESAVFPELRYVLSPGLKRAAGDQVLGFLQRYRFAEINMAQGEYAAMRSAAHC